MGADHGETREARAVREPAASDGELRLRKGCRPRTSLRTSWALNMKTEGGDRLRLQNGATGSAVDAQS